MVVADQICDKDFEAEVRLPGHNMLLLLKVGLEVPPKQKGAMFLVCLLNIIIRMHDIGYV